MCWICDQKGSKLVAEGQPGQIAGIRMTHGDKGYASMEPDGVGGDLKAYSTSNVTLLIGDDVPNGITTTRTIEVDGQTIVSTINTLGDKDFFMVQLVEGRTYDFEQFLTTTGPNGVPLADAYLELYDEAGNLLLSADGGGPNTPSGLDAILTFTAKKGGTYYINAKAYDDAAVGDYTLQVKDVTDKPTYKPYYDLESPLHSIDWGSQVDRTSRNPDGQEGPRVTGNAFTGVGSNPYGIEGKNVITVYFAKAGDIFVAEDPANPGLTSTMVAKGFQAWEKNAFYEAFKQYEKVADLVFVEVQNRADADFKLVTYNGTPGVGASLLGRMSPPNELNEGQGEFNAGDARWTEAGLQPGGFYFGTLLHELGHGFGLAHPHDNGGRSSVMRGAGGGTASIGGGRGDFGLSQGVFTMMSYNDGWETSGYGTPRSGGITGTQADHFGWIGSLSPLDIAVIQDKYGVNANFAGGDDVYIVKDENKPGTFYQAIWDTGGTDEIRYGGARNATIDLRAATLKYEEGGGGRVSHAFGIHGGYTIANGVTIENATSGSGADKLIGNDANNRLDAGAGADTLDGRGGNDVLIGGLGKDTMTGGDGADVFVFTSAADSAVGDGRDVITDFTQGSDKIDLQQLGAKTFAGTAAFSGTAGEVRYASTANATIIEIDADGNGVADAQIELSGSRALDVGDFLNLIAKATNGNDQLFGTNAADTINGLGGDDLIAGKGGNDSLNGGAGNDTLVGGDGKDVLTGGAGADIFQFASAAESTAGAGRDQVVDFQAGVDKLDLKGLGSIDFIGRKPFKGTAGELRVEKLDGITIVEFDSNGDKIADFQIELTGSINLTTSDFIFA